MVHEHAIVPLRERFGFGGPLFFAWVVPAAIVVAILTAVSVRFVFRQPSRIGRLLILAAGLYLAGALVLEMAGGWWSESRGPDNLAYQSITSVEELLEFVGASTYILAMMHILAERQDRVELTFTSSNPSG
ncbi:hypothetical protein BH23CHL2_BH23CHL2_01550 [soil metagenome]